jgi:hypothetical protein
MSLLVALLEAQTLLSLGRILRLALGEQRKAFLRWEALMFRQGFGTSQPASKPSVGPT